MRHKQIMAVQKEVLKVRTKEERRQQEICSNSQSERQSQDYEKSLENIEKRRVLAVKKRKKEKKNSNSPFVRDFLYFVGKLAFVGVIIYLLLFYIFGLYRNDDINMSPNVKDGDLVGFYRLDKGYVAGDVVLIEHNGKTMVQRVIAIGGDEVLIDDEYVRINGYIRHSLDEWHITGRTDRFEEGIAFPVKLAEDEIFLMGDNREKSTDSRIFGPVKQNNILGKIMLILRRRNF